MFFATLLLASFFVFSHNNVTMIADKDTWTFILENADIGDTLEVIAYKDGIGLGKFSICTVQLGFSCFASATPSVYDIGLWAGSVLINGVESGTFQVFVTKNLSCDIPPWIYIQEAQYPCWTLERIKTQYAEAEDNVKFYRWLMDKQFLKTDLEDNSVTFPKLAIIEHPDVFLVNGSSAAGVYKVAGVHSVRWDIIEYSLKHEATILPMVLMHELGHKRELDEEKKYTTNAVFGTFGWWHFGHGDFLDPLVQATNQVKNWFFRRMPQNHSYYPGQVGHEPAKGTPGTFPPVFPPSATSHNLFSNYYFEHDDKTAACILRPR